MTMPERSTDDLARCCRDERIAYYRANERHSPCCVALFRRAFAGDQDAWAEIFRAFDSYIWRLIASAASRYSPPWTNEDQEDLVQQTKKAFATSEASRDFIQSPEADNLGAIMKYLRRCAQREVLQFVRKQEVQTDQMDPRIPAPQFDHDERIALKEHISALLYTDDERLIFELRFIQKLPPAKILEKHPDRFADVKAVFWIIQRIRRRLWKDNFLRELYGIPPSNADDQENPTDSSESKPDHPSHGGGSSRTSKRRQRPRGPASLEIQAADAYHSEEPMEAPCALDDDILMDYNAGLLSEEQRAAVEANPACVARARQIAAELARIEAMLYRLTCPDVDTLIAYHDRQLESTNMLVIRRHVEQCDRCREELDLLAAMDATPFEEPGLLARARRVIEAAFQPALALQLRGQAHVYAAPHVTLTLSMRRIDGGAPRWTLVGELSTPDGAPFEQPVEQVVASRESAPDVRAEVDADGSFTIRDLPAGEYRLTVVTPDEEIVIRALRIGLSDEDS